MDSLPKVQREMEEVGAKALFLDPLAAFLGERVDTHNDTSTRRGLVPLRNLAKQTGARVLPIAEELHRRSVVNIQRVAQGLTDNVLLDMATLVVKRHRKFIEATEAAESSYADEVRARACLEWLAVLRNNEPIGRRGSVQLLDTVRYFDTIRTALTTKDGIETSLYSWDNRVRKPQRAGNGSDQSEVDQDHSDPVAAG